MQQSAGKGRSRSRPLRVLYVNTPTYLGGAELSLLDLAVCLDDDRFAPLLLTAGSGRLAHRAHEVGVPTYVQDFPWLSRRNPLPYGRALYNLGSLVVRHRVALIHTNCAHSIKYAVPMARLLGVPCICHVHDFQRKWHQPEYVQRLNHATRIVTISSALARECIGNGMRENRLVVMHNAIDVDAFTNVSPKTGQLARRQLGIPLTAPVVGIVGQVLPLKGHWEFVQAARSITAELPQTRFLVVGDDRSTPDLSFVSRVKAYIGEVGLDAQVHFLGFRDDVPEIMAALDVLAVPTHDEGFGRVVVEGMAAGKAVVASRVGGIPEIIEHRRTGLLVPVKDVQALAEAILGILRDPRQQSVLGKAARRVAKERFDLPDYVKRMEALYLSVLKRDRDWRSHFENR